MATRERTSVDAPKRSGCGRTPMSWRYELKYLVDTRIQAQLEPLVGSHLVRGEHVGEDGSYPVLSQYFDGPDLPFYLDKVIRSGEPSEVPDADLWLGV